ncbi:MG_279/MG_280 family protein [Malacoplasma iowae]|uniref:MG_279/MG_280 family protein n=1 Tax=Malacoplasma iowae TaxID=2116 RepID=UPI002A187424|nr:MG_279/MG_280 family protein [Malacoplasma iowae]WPL36473.1 MG_279/MG_280 family protein [Malacoplasma iowae]WPL38363.1 MG_279/MG_280 family protein [Malacoplasma iowae]
MVNMVRKLTKTVVLGVGTIVLGAVCTVGAVGLYFKEDAVKFYTQIRNEVQSISSTLDSGIDQFNTTIDKVQTLPGELKTEFEKYKGNFEEIASKLEKQANELEQQKPIVPSADKNDTSSTSQQLKELANQIRTAGNGISEGIDSISSSVDSVTSSEIVTQIKSFLNTVKTDYLPKVNQIIAQVTPEKFSEYYGFGATVMVATSGSILGLGLLSGLLTFGLYKNVDGKLVRKSSQKSELTSHIKYILKKYPEIKEKIIDEF